MAAALWISMVLAITCPVYAMYTCRIKLDVNMNNKSIQTEVNRRFA